MRLGKELPQEEEFVHILKLVGIGLCTLTTCALTSCATNATHNWSEISCVDSKIHFAESDICQFREIDTRSMNGMHTIEMEQTNIRGNNDVALYDITYRTPKSDNDYMAIRTPKDKVRSIIHYDDITGSAMDMAAPSESGDDVSVRFSKDLLKCVGLLRNGGLRLKGPYYVYSWVATGYVCLKNHPDAITDAEVNGLLATIKTSD